MGATNNREVMIEFANTYLGEYSIKTSGQDEKLIPTLCPLCHGGSSGKDKRTFALFLNNGTFVCKRGSCGRHGRFEELAKELSGQDVKIVRASTKKQVAKQYVLPTSEVFPPTEEIYKYFELRKISRSTVDSLRIGSDSGGNIVFRFYQDGEEIFRKYRHPRKPLPKERKEWQDSGTKSILYNLDNVVFSQPLILTEGMMDCISLIEAGLTNAVSVPSGCDNNDWIQNNWSFLEKFKTIVIFGDNDDPGKKAVATWAKRLGEYRTLVVCDYPEIPNSNPTAYCKDANEVLYRFGESKLIEMVESAEDIEVRGLIDLGDIELVDQTTVPRITTSIPRLDQAIGGLMEGSLLIVSGETGGGKSTICGQFLLSAIESGHNVCAYSGELPKEKFLRWLIFQAAGSEYVSLKYDPFLGKNVPFVPYEIQQRVKEWLKGKAYLYDNKEIFEKTQAESIVDMFTLAVRVYGASVFLVDNMMSSLCEEEEELRAQTKFINALKKFAERYAVSVICVSHPRKIKTGMPMTKYDVAGSQNIVNLSDATIIVQRPDIRVLKSRESGDETKIACVFLPDCRRIYQADVGDKTVCSWDKTGIVPPAVKASSLIDYAPRLSIEPAQPF